MATLLHPLVTEIDPGRFRNYCVIERRLGGALDDAGHFTESWTAIANSPVWLEIEPLSGRELWRAQGIFPESTHVVRGHWLAMVTADMRVVLDSRVFYLLEPPRNVGEQKIYMEALVREAKGSSTSG